MTVKNIKQCLFIYISVMQHNLCTILSKKYSGVLFLDRESFWNFELEYTISIQKGSYFRVSSYLINNLFVRKLRTPTKIFLKYRWPIIGRIMFNKQSIKNCKQNNKSSDFFVEFQKLIYNGILMRVKYKGWVLFAPTRFSFTIKVKESFSSNL